MKNSNQHIESLDYLRGIAILVVLLCHIIGKTFGYESPPWNGWFREFSVPDEFIWFPPLKILAEGVPIFFVVSGFCIHISFQQQGKSWGDFFVRRFFRIYPAYLASLILFFFLAYGKNFWHECHGWELWKQLLTHLFMVFNFDSSTLQWANPPFWSLAVEVQLYLLYPVLVSLVGRFGWRKSMLTLAAIELFIRGFEGVIQVSDGYGNFWGHSSYILTWSPFGFWCSWALGAFLADAYLKKQPLPFTKVPVMGCIILVVFCYFVKPLLPFRFLIFAVITTAIVSKFLNEKSLEKPPVLTMKLLKKLACGATAFICCTCRCSRLVLS